jgi:hypothetical protein
MRDRVSIPQSPRDATRARVTLRLQDFSIADRDTVYAAPRGGDWVLLALLVVVLLGNGLYVWHQRGLDDHIGRAVFFGLALFCLYWSAVVYTFKLSLGVHVGPHGLAIVRGPWRTELAWSEIGRLVERTEASNGRRYRWVVAMAYDSRRLQLREDIVANYQEFRVEVYERYRLWQEHGGTWGTNGGGPFTASDRIGGEVTWWLIGGGIFLLPALYFLILLPEVLLAGLVLLILALFCAMMVLRAVLRRQRYTIEPKFVESRRPLRRPIRLGWREITRVDRARHAAGWLMVLGIALGRLALTVASRSESRVESFAWSPRVPEYLILRGGGRQVRVRLHRLARPDELLAWVEFYERVARVGAERPVRPSMPIASRPIPELLPADLSGLAGPVDPWGSGRGGDPLSSGMPPQPQGGQQSVSGGAYAFPTAQPRQGVPSRPMNASRPLAQRVPGYAPMPAPPPDASRGPQPAAGQAGDDAWLRETRHNPRAGASSPGARPPAPGGPSTAAPSGSMPGSGSGAPPSYGPPPTPDGRLSQPPGYVPSPPQGPMVPGTYPGEWDIPDEVPPDPTGGLADSFALWRDENQELPQLPRFGPPPAPRPGE